MFRAAALGLAAVFPMALATSQDLEDRLTAKVHESEHGALPYRIFEPEGAADSHRLPLVLFLHGAGERGDDNKDQLRHGVADFVSDASQAVRPCFVLAPQCPRGVWWISIIHKVMNPTPSPNKAVIPAT